LLARIVNPGVPWWVTVPCNFLAALALVLLIVDPHDNLVLALGLLGLAAVALYGTALVRWWRRYVLVLNKLWSSEDPGQWFLTQDSAASYLIESAETPRGGPRCRTGMPPPPNGRPTGKGGDTVRVLERGNITLKLAEDRGRAEHLLLVETVRIVENVQGSQSAFLQRGGELIVSRPVIFTLPSLDRAPGEIHPYDLKPGRRDEIQILLMPARDMDVHARSLGQQGLRQVCGRGLARVPTRTSRRTALRGRVRTL
jgi:hypothetical protein